MCTENGLENRVRMLEAVYTLMLNRPTWYDMEVMFWSLYYKFRLELSLLSKG